jgi:hypothetical protein
MSKHLAVIALILIARIAAAETIPFDSPRWKIEGKESRVEEYRGKQSLYLKDGVARIADAKLRDGVVELDVAFHLAQGFSGV